MVNRWKEFQYWVIYACIFQLSNEFDGISFKSWHDYGLTFTVPVQLEYFAKIVQQWVESHSVMSYPALLQSQWTVAHQACNLWTVTHQAPSIEFSRQVSWSAWSHSFSCRNLPNLRGLSSGVSCNAADFTMKTTGRFNKRLNKNSIRSSMM